jgi:toxin YoeB
MFTAEYSKRFIKEYKRLYKYDKSTTDKVDELKTDTLEHPTCGLGQPEHLRHRKGNWWSRRIDKKNRLVYCIEGDTIYFEQCYGHYDDH